MFAPAAFNQNGRQYFLSANDNVMICVQIESRLAVQNVEEIAQVEGIGKKRLQLWSCPKHLLESH
jgi:4-hydroxy-2-oxoheptanedioate aldolase